MPTSRNVAALARLLPAPLRRWLHGKTGTRFARFVIAAVAAFAATQIALFALVLAHLSAGISGFIGAVVGAGVSYVLSRWAWERKGRPAVLTETLPFWLVSLSAWIVLSLAAHYGGVWANSMGAAGLRRAAIINGVTAAANCLTFLARFLIFHFILFAGAPDRGRPGDAHRQAVALTGTGTVSEGHVDGGLQVTADEEPPGIVTGGPGSAGSRCPGHGIPPGSAPR